MIPRGGLWEHSQTGRLPPQVPKKQKEVYTRINSRGTDKKGVKKRKKVYTRIVDTKAAFLV